MALVLEANYSKKLGLPGYSSHQYTVTLRTEINDLAQVSAESSRLHEILQRNVDEAIQKTGYLPAAGANGSHGNNRNGQQARSRDDEWRCSPKQMGLILSLIQEHKLDKNDVEQLARSRFGKGVKELDKLEASGLIDELIRQHDGRNGAGRLANRGGAR